MANSLLKLKVDSSEYDAKLKKAAEGIRHLADVAHRSDGDLTGLEKSTLDYVKAVGEMETKSRSAAGQVRELESTYKELKVVYDQLNDVEKADEGGKALAASLEQLKQRAKDAKAQLDEASKSLNDNEQASKGDSNSISDLTSKLGINIKSLVGWGAALGACKAALDVMKDALFQSESNVDEWGRIVQSSEGVYNGFLNALNNGDLSGFLNNISNIVSAARDAYNALDELGTRMTIINPERAKLQARQTELKATIRDKGADSKEGKAAQQELKRIQGQVSKAYGKESKMNMDAFEAVVRQRLAEGGINLNKKSFDQFMKTFSNDDAFQRLRNNAKGEIGYQNYVGSYKKVDNRNTEKKLLDLFTDKWRQENSQLLSAAFQAQGAAASNALGNTRYTRSGRGGGGKGGKTTQQQEQTELQQNQKKINELTQQYVDLSKQGLTSDDERLVKLREEIKELEKRNGLLGMYAEQAQGRMLLKGSDIDLSGKGVAKAGGLFGKETERALAKPAQLSDKAITELNKNMEAQMKQSIKMAKQSMREEKTITKVINKSKQFTGGLSEVSDGLKGLGIELPEGFDKLIGIINSVISVIEGVNAVIGVFQVGSTNANTAALIANTTAMYATGFLPFRNGGIVPHAATGMMVPGTDFSDRTPVMVSSGELILNKAQQGNLASQLQGSGMQNTRLEAVVRGEQLFLAENNRGRRTGRGEIVQSRRTNR